MLAMTGMATAVPEWRFDPPEEVLQSRLFFARGFMLVSGLFDELTLRALHTEAEAVRAEGQRGYVAHSDGTEGRGGAPARAYRSAPCGAIHRSLFGCRQMAETLGTLCGVTVSSTGGGTYSYYERLGDFLALHRDILQCDIALIAALTDPPETRGGELTIYPKFIRAPLSRVRAAGRAFGMGLPLKRGQAAVLLGGLVPHEVLPMSEGQERIVAINCYRVQPASRGDSMA
ncbi:MAG TPA: hypothetical protein VMB49_18280 [Acidobacteriaceae bacterium]|nr:hypothetical protein [Acidobacteriaceae bacterium]